MKFNIFILVSILFVFSLLEYTINKNHSLKEQIEYYESNQKALLNSESELKNSNKILNLKIEQLNYYNDSILVKLNNARKDLNIKNKEVKSLQYILSKIEKSDTIIYKDTIFNEDINVDTLIGDKWYNIKLQFKYPNFIVVSPSINSEKYIIVHYKKETIKPPKKCKLLRLFQRKHTVLEVNVLDKNPYIKNVNNKFIEIIK